MWLWVSLRHLTKICQLPLDLTEKNKLDDYTTECTDSSSGSCLNSCVLSNFICALEGREYILIQEAWHMRRLKSSLHSCYQLLCLGHYLPTARSMSTEWPFSFNGWSIQKGLLVPICIKLHKVTLLIKFKLVPRNKNSEISERVSHNLEAVWFCTFW